MVIIKPDSKSKSSNIKITIDTEVSTTELAAVLGLTARRVQQMAQDGTIDVVKKGKFNLKDSIRRYIEFISKDKELGSLEQKQLDAEVQLKEAKATKAMLEVRELQGEMHRSEDVADMTEDLIYSIRGMLIALPGRLAVDIVNVSSAAEVSDLIRREIYKVMSEISKYRYDPQKYEDRVRERQNWSTDDWSEPDE